MRPHRGDAGQRGHEENHDQRDEHLAARAHARAWLFRAKLGVGELCGIHVGERLEALLLLCGKGVACGEGGRGLRCEGIIYIVCSARLIEAGVFAFVLVRFIGTSEAACIDCRVHVLGKARRDLRQVVCGKGLHACRDDSFAKSAACAAAAGRLAAYGTAQGARCERGPATLAVHLPLALSAASRGCS